MEQAKPQRIVGRYALSAPIAAGGMATVHLGRLLGTGGFSRTVAIKRLHPQFLEAPDVVSTILDEARLASRIQHPNVVPVLDFFEDEGELFLVMEYVAGEPLHRLLKAASEAGRRTPQGIALGIMVGVLHGIHAAHEAKNELGEPLGIVHRDVSPQNILAGADGLARVLDFGIAKARGRLQTTREGQVKGKLRYMAPEQLEGREVGRETDVFAAAVVLWEVLTGRRLFQGNNEGSLVVEVLSKPIEPPSSVADDIPAELDAIVMRGLERNPARRFTTAEAFAAELERRGPVATTSEIGAWVRDVCGPALAARAADVAALEKAWAGRALTAVRGSSGAAVGSSSTEVTLIEQGASPSVRQTPADTPTTTGGAQPSTQADTARHSTPPARPTTIGRMARWSLLVGGLGLGAMAIVYARVPSTPTFAAPSTPAPEREPRTASEASASSVATAMVAPASASATGSEVAILVTTTPTGAKVMVGGEPWGTTPVVVHLPRNDELVRLEVSRSGYKTWSQRIARTANSELDIPLEPVEKKVDPPSAAQTKIRRFD